MRSLTIHIDAGVETCGPCRFLDRSAEHFACRLFGVGNELYVGDTDRARLTDCIAAELGRATAPSTDDAIAVARAGSAAAIAAINGVSQR